MILIGYYINRHNQAESILWHAHTHIHIYLYTERERELKTEHKDFFYFFFTSSQDHGNLAVKKAIHSRVDWTPHFFSPFGCI